jgi:hypothetical protein
VALLCVGCCPPSIQDITSDEVVQQKIRFDLSALDDEGLRGPPDGLRSLTYEFCIPGDSAFVAEVKAVDPTAKVVPGSGRISCTTNQHHMMGNTHQKNFRGVLYRLSNLDYIRRIEEVFFEE